jgi:hypothetical protein
MPIDSIHPSLANTSPNPAHWHGTHRPLVAKGSTRPPFSRGSLVPDNSSMVVACAGISTARLRFKFSGAGTLAFYFIDPFGNRYGSDNPASIETLADTEDMVEFDNIRGEGRMEIVAEDDLGTCEFIDWMGV